MRNNSLNLLVIYIFISVISACYNKPETSEILQTAFISNASELKTCVAYLGIEQFLADKNACDSEWTQGPQVAGDQVAYAGHVTVGGNKKHKFVYIGKYNSSAVGARYTCTLNFEQIKKLKQQDLTYSVLQPNNSRFFENTVRCGQQSSSGDTAQSEDSSSPQIGDDSAPPEEEREDTESRSSIRFEYCCKYENNYSCKYEYAYQYCGSQRGYAYCNAHSCKYRYENVCETRPADECN